MIAIKEPFFLIRNIKKKFNLTTKLTETETID